MSSFGDKNFLLEVAKGNVTGHSLVSVFGKNPLVGSTAIEDIWDPGGVRTDPTANETWEALSDDANDTSAGTGARTLRSVYLDDLYAEKTTDTTMNGVTPVTMPADMFRHIRTRVLTKGTSAGNEGNITIRVSGVGATRAQINAPNANGKGQENRTLDSHYTVKAGHTAFVAKFLGGINKNEDVELELKSTIGADGIYANRLTLYLYQSLIDSTADNFSEPFIEKTDIKVQSISSNTNAVGTLLYQLILINNDFVTLP